MKPEHQEESDDLTLLDRIVNRDTKAFEVFYDRHAPWIFALLIRIIGDHSEAEDVLQEVFWQIWRGADTYRAARGTPRAWLVQIARSRGIDCLRKIRLKSRRDAGVVEEVEIAPVPGHTGEGKMVEQETQRSIEQALGTLPAEQRQAIMLSFFDDLTHEEIAKKTGVALGTIKTRIRLGLGKMYEAFMETGRIR